MVDRADYYKGRSITADGGRVEFSKSTELIGGKAMPSPRAAVDAAAAAAGCLTMEQLQEVGRCLDIAAKEIRDLKSQRYWKKVIDDSYL